MTIKNRIKREEIANELFKNLPSKEILEQIQEPDDLSRLDYYGAIQRFKAQSYSDTVIHSSISVEIALLFRLDKKLNSTEKQVIKAKGGLTFGGVINKAYKKEILNKEDYEKAITLNHLRNMLAHPGNHIALIKSQKDNLPTIIENLSEEISKDKETIEKLQLQISKSLKKFEAAQTLVHSYVDSRLETIPDLSWSAKQDTLSAQQAILDDYYKNMVKQLFTKEGLKELLKNLGNLVSYAQSQFSYKELIETKALLLCNSLLVSLGVLEKPQK